jgi:hypothetical protein
MERHGLMERGAINVKLQQFPLKELLASLVEKP